MKNSTTVKFICILVGAAGALNLLTLFSEIPAFHQPSRREGVYGDWRVAFNIALYDRAEYLYALASDYIATDTISSSATEESNEIASLETVFKRADRAVELFEESISLNPSDAYTWAGLAWAYSLQGELSSAREAMMNSWNQAPNNSALSHIRLEFMEMLLGTGEELLEAPISAKEYAAMQQDFCAASLYQSGVVKELLELSPEISLRFNQQEPNCGKSP